MTDLRTALNEWDTLREHGVWSDEDEDFVFSAQALADEGAHLADAMRELLSEPTNVQALALARLMRDRPGAQVVVHRDVFDLPNGYWLAIIGLDGFQCGIAPDGSVSS